MRRYWWWLGLGIVVLAGGLVTSRWPAPTVAKPRLNVPALVAAATPQDHGYAGWKVCAECHGKRVAEFQQTRHFLALQFPDQVTFPRGFHADSNRFQPSNSPVAFTMSASNGMAMISATPIAAPKLTSTSSAIEFVYGAGGGTDEVYFTRRGNQLFELPVAWMHPQGEWGASLFDPHGSGDLSRPLTPQCLECHTTWVDYHRGTLNEYGPLQRELVGVTCERCHGPGKAHVDHHRSSPGATTGIDIIAPKSMTRQQRMDLCAQCHTNAVRHRKAPFSYRPGEAIEEAYRILKMRYPEEDRVANQVQYLQESRCYQQSETLTCVNCHDPHHAPSKGDSSRTHDVCRSCHQPDNCGAQDRLPTGARDQCVACHMPLRNKIQVGFTTRDEELAFPATRYEHRIAIYPEAEFEVLLNWHNQRPEPRDDGAIQELRRKLAIHWTAVAEAAANEQRFLRAIDAYRQAIHFVSNPQLQERLKAVSESYRLSGRLWFEGIHFKQERRFDEAIATFERLLQIEPKSAKGHLELGTLLVATGKNSAGITHLTAAAELDVNDPGPHAMLGWIEFLARRPQTALNHYQQAADIEPWSKQLEYMKGQCFFQLGRYDEAVLSLQRTLEIDPHHRDAAKLLCRLLTEHYSAADALDRAARGVELTSARQADLLLLLANIYVSLNKLPEATEVIAAARTAAIESDVSLLPKIDKADQHLATERHP